MRTADDTTCYTLCTAPGVEATLRESVATWLLYPSLPVTFMLASGRDGVRVHARTKKQNLFTDTFSNMTRNMLHWRLASQETTANALGRVWLLRPRTVLPQLAHDASDAFTACAQRLLAAAEEIGGSVEFRIRVSDIAQLEHLQLRALAANTDSAWAERLRMGRVALYGGAAWTACGVGLTAAGMLPTLTGLGTTVAGAVLAGLALVRSRWWLRLRRVSPAVLERYAEARMLLRARCVLTLRGGDIDARLPLEDWFPWVDSLEPVEIEPAQWARGDVDAAYDFPLLADDLAALLTPTGDTAAKVLHPATQIPTPTPRPSREHRTARFQVGRAVAGRQPVGIDPDGHGIIAGGSEDDRLSLAYALLEQLLGDDDPPGLFLLDPSGRLCDAFLTAVADLPEEARRAAIERLLVITPEQAEVVPLNLVAHPDRKQALRGLIQTGSCLWPQSWDVHEHLAALFRLVYTRNKARPQESLSLFHLLAAVMDEQWQREAWSEVPRGDDVWLRALDQIVGHLGEILASVHPDGGRVTTLAPLVVTLMAAARVPWLYAACSRPDFVDFAQAVRDKSWVIVRTPTHILGREGSRLLAGLTYNMWQAAFCRLAHPGAPIPHLVVADDTEGVLEAMHLKRLLTQNSRLGARIFVLTESLMRLRQRMSENGRSVGQLLGSNASTQVWFAPAPADVELVRNYLGLPLEYASNARNLPPRTCWLRTRIDGRWQSPLLLETDPIRAVKKDAVCDVLRDVIMAHPECYVRSEAGDDNGWDTLPEILSDRFRGIRAGDDEP